MTTVLLDDTACLGSGISLADMRIAPSGDGQYLLIYCRRDTDAGRLSAMELIERL